MLAPRLQHILFPPSPVGLFLRHSQVFTHGMVLPWGVICGIWICWNREMVNFTGLSFQEFKDVHVLNVNLSISVEENTTEIVMLCWIALGAESQNLCDSNPLARSVALPWASHYSYISSLTHQNVQCGPPQKSNNLHKSLELFAFWRHAPCWVELGSDRHICVNSLALA